MCTLVPNKTSLHQELKDATRDIHESLHGNYLLCRLTAPNCTLDEYRLVLQAFYRFYFLSEKKFTLAEELWYRKDAPLLQWLRDDLIALGFPVPSSPPALQNFACFQPFGFSKNKDGRSIQGSDAANNLAAYLGHLYVKQGSMLGGQVICRALQRSLHLSPSTGLRFFNGFGGNTRALWLDFLHYLQMMEIAVDTAAVVTSALHRFRMIEQLLNEALEAVS